MAKYAPSEEELKWYEDTMAKDPLLKNFNQWDYLPFTPVWYFPEWFVPIVTRDEWGALPPRPGVEPLTTPVLYIRYTWVGKEECDSFEDCSRFLRNLQKTSMEEGLSDIPFNFLIGGKGIMYEGRGWDVEAEREERHNKFEGLHGPLKGKTLDIAYIGDMSFYGPSNEMQQAACHFVQVYSRSGKIDHLFEPLPYRERPGNIRDPAAYWDVDDIPNIAPEDKAKIDAFRKQVESGKLYDLSKPAEEQGWFDDPLNPKNKKP